jgi:hypothetical protein
VVMARWVNLQKNADSPKGRTGVRF